MADRDSERDRRVRELLSGKKKDQMAVLGQSRAEIQDIQSELQNHIALQQAQDQARLQQAQTISQAAGGMLAMEEGDQLQGQVASMNPQTQATLGKYGVKPGRTQNITRNQSGGRTVSKSGDITNIKNETITNNRTEIKVTQPTIPMSQPNIPVQAATHKKEDNTAKFKAWLSGMFAKQQNEAEIQRKEYRKKEWNLGRTTSRLMKRIEESTTALGQKLDPRNMTSTLGGQLKWLLLIFGATMIAKVWKPTMKFLANLEGGFRAVFGLPMNTDLQNASTGTLSVIDQIKDFIGIKKGEDTSLIGGIGRVFMEGIDKLIDKLKFWFEDRATALRDVEFPSFDTPDFGPLGKIMAPIMEGLTDTFKGMTQYLGDLITVALGGSKGKVKVAAKKISRQAQDVFTDTSGKKTSAGDEALIKGSGRSYMRKSDYDSFGNLKSNASSTQAMSQSLISMFNDKSGKAHTAEISTGIGQLFDVADRSGKVVISPELLGYLGLTQADVTDLRKNKYLRQEKYRIIGVKPTTDAQREEMGAYTGSAGFWGGGVAGTLGGGAAGAALGSLVGPLGTAIGAIIGGATGGYLGSAGGAAADEVIKRWTTNGLYPKLVPSESHEVGDDGSPGVPKMMWVLTKKGADIVTQKFTKEMTNKDMDITNKEFYDKIRRIEERQKRSNGVSGPITQNLSTNDLNVAQANYAAYNQRYYDKFVSTDPNSENMQNYGHLNTFINNASGVFSNMGSYVSNGVRAVGNFVTSERLSGKQETSRSNYLIQALMQKSGLTKEQAAGVAGNIMRESGFVTNRWGDNHTSVGIAQWHDDRITRYNKEYGAKGHLADASFEQQVDYLIWEAEKDGIMGKMRQTRSSAEAANTWERSFERSQDYAKNGNRYRIEYAAKALNSFNDSSGSVDMSALQSQRASMATYYKGESPFKLEGETSTVGGANIIAWIGDSHSELGLPVVVGNKLKSKFGCQYVWGAYHGYSAYSHLKNKPYQGVCSRDNKVDNFSGILNKKPGIVIVELGANDANGVDGNWREGIPKLIDVIKSSGAKVVWLTPFGYSVGSKNAKKNAIDLNKSANRVREYILSRSDISVVDVGGFVNFYSGQATPWDKFVGNDGLHWNSTGYKTLGEWIGGVLTGVVSNPGFTSEDLEKQDGIFGAVSENVGEFITNLADKIEGEKTDSQVSPLGNIKLTEEQKKILERHINYENVSSKININSYLALGAKSDETGLFFEDHSGNRAYVNAKRSTGLLGLTESDIEFTAKRGKDGRLTGDISEEDQEMIKRSVLLRTESLFSDYEGKGTTTDILEVDGKPQEFDLGSFNDLNFSKSAILYFDKLHRGFVHYYITPTKDRTNFSLVRINPIPNPMLKMGDWEKDFAGDKEIGPYIYKKGWKRRPVGGVDKKVTTDWQPLAEFYNVKFTPKAFEKLSFLFKLLSYGKLTMEGQKIKTADGKYLSNEEKILAGEFGILKVTETTSYGPEKETYTSRTYSINDSYNKSQEIASRLFKDKQFKYDDYLKTLGISSEKDVNKFYKENKDLFYNKNGILIGPSGVEWGTVDEKGNVKLFDKKEFSERALKTGTSGFNENLKWIKHETSRQAAINLGMIDRNSIVDLYGSVDFNSPITKEEQEKLNQRYNRKTDYIDKWGELGGTKYKYRVFFDESGNPINYQITRYEQAKFFSNLTGDEINVDVIRNDINTKTHKDLFTLLKNKVTDQFKKSGKKLTSGILNSTHEYGISFGIGLEGSKDFNESDRLFSFLVQKRLFVSDIEVDNDGCTVLFENGTKQKTSYKISEKYMNENEKNKFISAVNKAIKEGKEKIGILRFSDKYEGSEMKKNTDSILNEIKSGNQEGIEDDNGNVFSSTGDLVGKVKISSDGKKEYQYLTGEEQYKHLKENYWSSQENKIDAYKRLFGAVQEGNDLYVYNKFKTTRVKIDLSKPFTTDLQNILIGSSAQGKEGNKWIDVSKAGDQSYDPKTGKYEDRYWKSLWTGGDNWEYNQQNVLNSIVNDIKGSVDTSIDLQEKAQNLMIEKLEDQLNQDLIAAKKQTEQIIQEKKIALATKKQADLFEEWANNGFQTGVDLSGIIEKLGNEEAIEMAKTLEERAIAQQKAGENSLKGGKIVRIGTSLYLEKPNKDGTRTRHAISFDSSTKSFNVSESGEIIRPMVLAPTNDPHSSWSVTGLQFNPLGKVITQTPAEKKEKTPNNYIMKRKPEDYNLPNMFNSTTNYGVGTQYNVKVVKGAKSGKSDTSLNGKNSPSTGES